MKKYLRKALTKLDKLDSTQVRRIIEALGTENHILHTALDSLLDGVVACDNNYQTLFTNVSARRFLQLAEDFDDEEPIWKSISHRAAAEFFEESLRLEITGESEDFTIDDRLVSCTILPLAVRGRIGGALFTIRDVTETRKNEEREMRIAALSRLSSMAAVVAHEVKNPLGAMSIHLQILQKKMCACEDEDIHAGLTALQEEIVRLNQVASGYLFASSPMELKLVKVDLRKLIDNVLFTINPELKAGNIEVETRYPAEPVLAVVDESLIKHALINLTRNAQAAMPEGGFLTLSTEELDETILLSVTDTGEGISDERKKKMFEPYFSTKNEGSGLGLSIVYKIISSHGGEIDVSSPPCGQRSGARFVLKFPAPASGSRLLSAPQLA